MEAKKPVPPLKITTPLEKIPEFHPKEATLEEIEQELERVKNLPAPGMSDVERKQLLPDALMPLEMQVHKEEIYGEIPWVLVGGSKICEKELMKYYTQKLGSEELAVRAGCHEFVKQLTAISHDLPYDSYFMILFQQWTPISYVVELATMLHDFCGGNVERIHIQSSDGALGFMGYRHDADMICGKVHEFCKKKHAIVDFKAYGYHHTPVPVVNNEAIERLLVKIESYGDKQQSEGKWFVSALKEAAEAGLADPKFVKELLSEGSFKWLEEAGLTPDEASELVEKARQKAASEHEPDDQAEEESEEEEEEDEEEESEDESVSQP